MLQLPGGVSAEVLVRCEDTDGAFTLIRDHAPVGWRLPPHRHLNESETIHVTAGRLWMRVDGERRVVAAGETAHVPAGTLHESGTDGERPVERLVVFAPGGMDSFFEALAATPDPADALALAAAHGWRFPSDAGRRRHER